MYNTIGLTGLWLGVVLTVIDLLGIDLGDFDPEDSDGSFQFLSLRALFFFMAGFGFSAQLAGPWIGCAVGVATVYLSHLITKSLKSLESDGNVVLDENVVGKLAMCTEGGSKPMGLISGVSYPVPLVGTNLNRGETYCVTGIIDGKAMVE